MSGKTFIVPMKRLLVHSSQPGDTLRKSTLQNRYNKQLQHKSTIQTNSERFAVLRLDFTHFSSSRAWGDEKGKGKGKGKGKEEDNRREGDLG
jgi:hypothetical protein